MADPGSAALHSLYQVTCTLLVHGSSKPATAENLATLVAIRKLLDAADREFLAAHNRLEEAEAAVRDLAQAGSLQADDSAPASS